MIPVKVIGTLESCFREKFGTPRQPHVAPSSTARLRVHRDFRPEHSLKGLEEFSHLWLLFYFHLNTNKTFRPKVHPPRLQGKTIGVFASRSPHRPTPLGLTLTRLCGVEGDVLYLSGIDLIDGTPVVDIKPYIPGCDSMPDARAGWLDRVPPQELSAVFSPEALADLAALGGPKADAHARIIAEMLLQDPRNPRDRSQMRDGNDFELFLFDYLVRFSVVGREARVFKVEPAPEFTRKAPRPSPKPGL